MPRTAYFSPSSGRVIRTVFGLLAMTLLLGLGACKVESDDSEQPVRRLTPVEYNNTIRDLYGWSFIERVVAGSTDDYETAKANVALLAERTWVFPKELGFFGFQGFSEQQTVSPYLIEQLESAAAYFAPMALDAPYFSTCRDLASRWANIPEADQAGCQWDSVVRFAHRAFRRPLDTDETDRLRAFHDGNVAEYGHSDGTVLTVQGILQTPSFLYMVEAPSTDESDGSGGADLVNSWEMASRLSYFLWDSMPDAALFAAANLDELKTQEQVEAQATRMLNDPRAREAVVLFHEEWFQMDKVFGSRADLDTYGMRYIPELLEDLDDTTGLQGLELWSAVLIAWRLGMSHEAKLFIEETIFDGGGRLANLMTDNAGYVTEIGFDVGDPALPQAGSGATIVDGPSYRWVLNDGVYPFSLELKPATFPEGQRAGVLTLPAVLTGRAHPIHPAPVLRGRLILERMACVPIPTPPDGAAAVAPPDSAAAASTNRERIDAVTLEPSCASCHAQINPLGFAYENFDSLGGWRETDNGEPVDATGVASFVTEPDVTFDGPIELAEYLAQSEAIHDCYTRTWLRYALARLETLGEVEDLSTLQTNFKDGAGDVRDLLVSIAGSDVFRKRASTLAEGSEQ